MIKIDTRPDPELKLNVIKIYRSTCQYDATFLKILKLIIIKPPGRNPWKSLWNPPQRFWCLRLEYIFRLFLESFVNVVTLFKVTKSILTDRARIAYSVKISSESSYRSYWSSAARTHNWGKYIIELVAICFLKHIMIKYTTLCHIITIW